VSTKKIILILSLLVFISGCIEQIEESNEEQQLATTVPFNCEDYDGNQEACLLYEECEWVSEENLCETLDEEGDFEHEDEEEEIEDVLEGDFQYESPWIEEEGKRIDDGYFWDVSIVQLDDGTYRMYGEKGTSIESYISDDGLSWEKEDGIRLRNAAFPLVLRTDDEKWRMFFCPSGQGIQQNKFLSAISSDGLNFVKEDGERYKGEGNLEEKIQGPRIIPLDDGTYRMYFTATSNPDTKDETLRILSAKSDDGFNFVKEDGIRLDPNSEPFVGERVAHAWPIKTSDGKFQVFFSGATANGGGILSATSENGLDFTINPYPEIEETFIEEEGIGISPQDPCVISMDGKLRMYYGLYKGSEVVDESGIYSAVFMS